MHRFISFFPGFGATLLMSAVIMSMFTGILFVAPESARAEKPCSAQLVEKMKTAIAKRLGGVKLDLAATFLADMTDITGAYYDEVQDRIVFVGRKNTVAPKFNKDDLAVAIRSVFFYDTVPAVSMEFKDPANPFGHDMMNVIYYGGIADTEFGKTLFEADWKLKQYIHGYDENGNKLTSSVPGYKSHFDRFLDNNPNPDLPGYSRWWIVPKDITVKRDAAADAFVFDRVSMEVKTEGIAANNDPAWTNAALAFAKHQTDNYDLYAQETPAYFKTKQLAKVVSIVKWIKDNNVPTDNTWAHDYQPTYVATPREARRLTTPQVERNGRLWWLTGGVQYTTPNGYSADDGTAKNIKVASEAVPAAATDFHWSFTNAGQQYESVAVAADVFESFGAYATSETDVSIPMAGDVDLTLKRAYSSYATGTMGMGNGWDIIPAKLVDLMPGWISSCRPSSGYTGEYPYKIALQTLEGGRETFTYYCDFTYKPDDPSYHSQLWRNADGSFTAKLKNLLEYDFDISFKLLRIRDKNNNAIEYVYGNNRLNALRSSSGHQLTLTYDAASNITKVADWANRSVNYTYDNDRNLTSVSDTRGFLTRYSYDAKKRLTRITNRVGQMAIENTYTEEGKLATQKNSNGIVHTYSYDNKTRTITVRDASGRTSQTRYDEKGRVLETSDPANQKTTYTYGTEPIPVTVKDKRNKTTTFTYDSNGNITEKKFPDGGTVRYFYNARNQVTEIHDHRYAAKNNNQPRKTTYTYDDKGNLREENVAGVFQRFGYDHRGVVISTTDTKSNSKLINPDIFGNPTAVIDLAGGRQNFTYDALGRLTREEDEQSNWRTYSYDTGNNLLENRTLVGAEKYSYDGEGRVSEYTDRNGVKTTYTYTPSGKVTRVTDGTNKVTTYNYDAYDNMIEAKDGRGNSTRYSYDTLNRQVSMTTPLNKQYAWHYDANDNIVRTTSPDGTPLNYAYDELNRTTAKQYPDLSTGEYTYDARGNVLTSRTSQGLTTYTYGLHDRVASVTDPYGMVVRYTYDLAGNIITLDYPDNKRVTYTYTPQNQVKTVTDWNQQVITYSYHPNKLLASQSLPNGITTTYVYDAANRLQLVTHYSPQKTILAQYRYDRDANGNVTKAYESTGAPGAISTMPALAEPAQQSLAWLKENVPQSATTEQSTNFLYDALGRLTQGTYPLTANPTKYTYDNGSNIISQTQTTGEIQRTYNADNQLTQSGTTSLRYDGRGNVIEKANTTNREFFAYDAENRLVSHLKELLPLEPSYTPVASGPFTPIIARTYAAVTFGDLTGDGLQDMIVANRGGALRFMKNTGTRTEPVYTYERVNDLPTSGRQFVSPALDDVDKDGDLDLVIGFHNATPQLFINYGTKTHPAFRLRFGNFGKTEVKNRVVPQFADLDGDGNTDFVVAEGSGTVKYFRYIGQDPELKVAQYTFVTDLIRANRTNISPTFSDLDKDGDMDMAVAGEDGRLEYYRNTGSRQSPAYTRISESLGGIALGEWFAPALTDYNSDSHVDLVIGRVSGQLESYTATPPAWTQMSATTFTYDSRGNRIAKTGNNQTTRYTNHIAGKLSHVLTENNQKNQIANYMVYGTELVSQGTAAPTSRTYPLTDGLGNVRLIVNHAGAVTNRYAYDAFGVHTTQQEAQPNTYLFDHQQYDTETGLYYLRARYYDPETARFISRDPFPGLPTLPQTQHPYAYALNDPINESDRSGMFAPIVAAILEGVWDFGNIIYDLATCDWTSLSIDTAALFVPFVPAGVTKFNKAFKYGDDAWRLFGKGNKEYILSKHAAERMAQRNLSPDDIMNTLQKGNSFEYYHDGSMKIGFYDPKTKIFVSTSGNSIITAIANVTDQYIKNLRK